MIGELKYRHWFSYVNGRIIFDESGMYKTNLDQFQYRRGYMVMYDESESKPVSKESRAYYFKVLIKEFSYHSDFYGMSDIDIHHELMRLFCGTWILIEFEWEEWYPPMSSLNQLQWNWYIELVSYYAEMRGIILKPVNKYIIR